MDGPCLCNIGIIVDLINDEMGVQIIKIEKSIGFAKHPSNPGITYIRSKSEHAKRWVYFLCQKIDPISHRVCLVIFAIRQYWNQYTSGKVIFVRDHSNNT